MSRLLKAKHLGFLLLAVVLTGVLWLELLSSNLVYEIGNATSAHATSSLPYNEFANGPYTVQGNAILGADGKRYLFHGIGRIAWNLPVKAMGFLMPSTLHIWALVPTPPTEPTGMPTRSGFPSARATG